jgi:rhodanese-related sulfurtransferase
MWSSRPTIAKTGRVLEEIVDDTETELVTIVLGCLGDIGNPGAVSLPRRKMSAKTTAQLDRNKVYVDYCDGIDCNASTKGAYNLAGLGFRVEELLGGIDWWRRDGHPVTVSHEPGSLLAAE